MRAREVRPVMAVLGGGGATFRASGCFLRRDLNEEGEKVTLQEIR